MVEWCEGGKTGCQTQSDDEQTISCCRRPVSVLQPCKSDFSDAVFLVCLDFLTSHPKVPKHAGRHVPLLRGLLSAAQLVPL